MRMKIFAITILAFVGIAYGAGVVQKMQTDTVQLGVGSSTDDKQIIFDTGDGGSNARILVDDATQGFDLNKALDITGILTTTGAANVGGALDVGGNSVTLGDGAASDKSIVLDRGGSNPSIRWSESSSKIQFTNDGTNYKNLGSGSGGGGGGDNLLVDTNFDFEAGTSPWAATGGTFVLDTATQLDGLASGTFDASALGQYLSQPALTIKRSYIGRRCSADFIYQYTGATGDYDIEVYDTGNLVATAEIVATTGSNVGLATSPHFDCPGTDTDTLEVRIVAGVADPGLIRLDNVFLGADRNIVQLSQGGIAGESFFAETGGCTWTRTNVAPGPFTANASCPGPTITMSRIGEWLTTDSDLPRQTIQNLPAGNYKATFYVRESMSASAVSFLTISDGTTNCQRLSGEDSSTASSGKVVSCTFTYTSAQPSKSFELFGGSSANTIQIGNTTSVTRFQLEYSPLSSAEALTLNTSGLYASALWDADCLWTRASGTFGDFSAGDASCTFVQQNGSSLNVFSGEISSNKVPWLVANFPASEAYEVCYQGAVTSNSGSGVALLNRIVDDLGTIIAQGPTPQTGSANYFEGVRSCGIYVPPVGQRTLKIQIAGSGTTQLGSSSNVTYISVKKLSQGFSAPIFTEVRNKMNAGESDVKEYRIRITNSGTPTIVTQSPLGWVSSLDDNGVGNVDLNFPGVFTQNPYCFVQITDVALVALGDDCKRNTISASELNVRCHTESNSTPFDRNFEVVCSGR